MIFGAKNENVNEYKYNTMQKNCNAKYMSIRKRIWSAAMAPKTVTRARFKQFSFKPV